MAGDEGMLADRKHQAIPVVSEETWLGRLRGGTYGVLGLYGGVHSFHKLPNNYLSAAKTNGSRAEYFQEFPNPRNHMPSPEGWKNAKPASVTSRPTVLPTQNALVVAQVEGDVFIDRLQLQGGRLQGCSLRGCDQDPSDPAAGWRLQVARLRPGSLGPGCR